MIMVRTVQVNRETLAEITSTFKAGDLAYEVLLRKSVKTPADMRV